MKFILYIGFLISTTTAITNDSIPVFASNGDFPEMLTNNTTLSDNSPNVSASDGDYTRYVRVDWQEYQEADEYQVYRANSVGGDMKPISEWQTETLYQDSKAVPGIQYEYATKSRTSSGKVTDMTNIRDVGHRPVARDFAGNDAMFRIDRYENISITTSSNSDTGYVEIEWDDYEDDVEYQLYRWKLPERLSIDEQVMVEYQKDAARLALSYLADGRNLSDVDIHIPEDIQRNIFSALMSIYHSNDPYAQKVTAMDIHTKVNPYYIDGIRIKCSEDVTWTKPLSLGDTITANKMINDKLAKYGLKITYFEEESNLFGISARTPINMKGVTKELYKLGSGIDYALIPEIRETDNNIEAEYIGEGIWIITFYKGENKWSFRVNENAEVVYIGEYQLFKLFSNKDAYISDWQKENYYLDSTANPEQKYYYSIKKRTPDGTMIAGTDFGIGFLSITRPDRLPIRLSLGAKCNLLSVQLVVPFSENNAKISITDQFGRMITEQSVDIVKGFNQLEIGIERLNVNTIYFVYIQSADWSTVAQKFVKCKTILEKYSFSDTISDIDGDGLMDMVDRCPFEYGSSIYDGCPLPTSRTKIYLLNISASDGDYENYVRVSWDKHSEEAEYQLHRGISGKGTDLKPINDWQKETFYFDRSAAPGQKYYYGIKIRTATGKIIDETDNLDVGYRSVKDPIANEELISDVEKYNNISEKSDTLYQDSIVVSRPLIDKTIKRKRNFDVTTSVVNYGGVKPLQNVQLLYYISDDNILDDEDNRIDAELIREELQTGKLKKVTSTLKLPKGIKKGEKYIIVTVSHNREVKALTYQKVTIK